MKKIFLFTFLLLATFYSDAQKKDIRTQFINCGAVKIQNSDAGIVQEINDKGKISFTRQFIVPNRIKKSIYLKVKWKLMWGSLINDFLVDDKENYTLLSYQQELNGPLNYSPKEKDFIITFSSKISIQDYSYKVEISDITFAKAKNKNGKTKTGKRKAIESIFQEKQPNCEIIKYLDEFIVDLLDQHRLDESRVD